MKPYVHDITGTNVLRAFAAVKHHPFSLLLDSADPDHPHSRYSFMMCQPIETIVAHGQNVTITNWDERVVITGNPFEILQQRIAKWGSLSETLGHMPPFQGGAAGLFSYDLVRVIEDLPQQATTQSSTPDMAFGIYDQVIAHDHFIKKTYILTHAPNEETATKKRAHLLDLIADAPEIPPYEAISPTWAANFTAETYAAQVQKVIDYIYAGDIFQANLAQRFDASLPEDFDSYAHFCHMRDINPAPFMCYMNCGDVQISSASPEQFISVKDRMVSTRPIKGTMPRGASMREDRANRLALENSDKDHAENVMIVDLLRNDLSKTCMADSITVPALCQTESFAGVHHLVSTIEARLKHDETPLSLLYGAFAGGSVTGAPKIRAMEIIDELEPTRRAAYCGSIGYVGFDGTMDTNILIRTLTYENGSVSVQVGGGITASSDPAAEYQETLDKAHKILTSF